MNDYGPLFDPSGDDAEGPRTWGVLELNRAIEVALQQAFPGEIWIRGEIQGLARTRMRKHWYFELVEKDPHSDQPAGRIGIALLSWNRPKVERSLAAVPDFELEDDVEVRIRCQVSFYPPWGKLQLAMTGIDPSFTLGQMAANRDRILRVLAAEGLLDRNADLELPLVPRRIGLVTSIGSAAYNDFVHELESSGLGLRVRVCDARMQGVETEKTVIAAMATLVRSGCDLLVIARGGGSRSDLAGFDSERIARAIARCPVPVLTGIGHEIDTSVADVVAHRSFKTPTATADFIVEHVRATLHRVDEIHASIVAHAEDRLHSETDHLIATSRHAARAAKTALLQRERDLRDRVGELRRQAAERVASGQRMLNDAARRAESSVRVRLAEREAALGVARRALQADRLERSWQRRAVRVAEARRRLIVGGERRLVRLESDLTSFGRQVKAFDPRSVLRRGYSLTYDAAGQLVRDARQMKVGAKFRVSLAAGEIHGTVSESRPAPDDELGS